jgi:hypothetical protein
MKQKMARRPMIVEVFSEEEYKQYEKAESIDKTSMT